MLGCTKILQGKENARCAMQVSMGQEQELRRLRIAYLAQLGRVLLRGRALWMLQQAAIVVLAFFSMANTKTRESFANHAQPVRHAQLMA